MSQTVAMDQFMMAKMLQKLSMDFGLQNPDVKEISHQTIEDESIQSIRIPTGMSKLEASKELKRQHEEEETEIDMVHEFKEWEARDGLHAIMVSLEQTFGWINAQPGFFSNPTELQIVTDITGGKITTKDAFIGKFKAASWDDAIGNVGMRYKNDDSEDYALIKFNVKKKHKERVKRFFNLIFIHTYPAA